LTVVVGTWAAAGATLMITARKIARAAAQIANFRVIFIWSP
jgi:hypothetical protein